MAQATCRTSDKLVNLTRDGDYHSGAYDRSDHNGHPLLLDNAGTLHQTHAGGDKEEAEITYQEVGETLHPLNFDNADLERACEQYHADDA